MTVGIVTGAGRGMGAACAERMAEMVDMVRYDSDELFKAIERENPFTAEAKQAFFTAARRLEEKLAKE